MRNGALWVGAVGVTALGAYVLRRRSNDDKRDQSSARERTTVPPEATRRLPRSFDPIFEKYGRGLPLPYLRALAKRESNMEPHERKGPAWGLLQVVRVVLRDFNKRHGTSHVRFDLLDPKINVAIATDTLARIIASYQRNHPDVPNMQVDWSNPRFVELLTFGWNAGYSERAGVGRVARFLERIGRHQDITIDTIHRHADAVGASRHLSNPKKVAWSKSVARLHTREARKAVA